MSPLPEKKFIRKPQLVAALKVAGRGPRGRRDQMLIFLAAALGLRATEAVRMRVENFRDGERGWVYVASAKKRRRVRCSLEEAARRKEQGYRNPRVRTIGFDAEHRPEERLPLAPDVWAKVKEYAGGRRRGWLFPGADGESPLTTRQAFNIFSEACKAAKVGHRSFHALRHYRGFTVQAAKGDLDWTRRMLRHTDTKVTQIYTERTPEEEKKMAEEIGW